MKYLYIVFFSLGFLFLPNVSFAQYIVADITSPATKTTGAAQSQWFQFLGRLSGTAGLLQFYMASESGVTAVGAQVYECPTNAYTGCTELGLWPSGSPAYNNVGGSYDTSKNLVAIDYSSTTLPIVFTNSKYYYLKINLHSGGFMYGNTATGTNAITGDPMPLVTSGSWIQGSNTNVKTAYFLLDSSTATSSVSGVSSLWLSSGITATSTSVKINFNYVAVASDNISEYLISFVDMTSGVNFPLEGVIVSGTYGSLS